MDLVQLITDILIRFEESLMFIWKIKKSIFADFEYRIYETEPATIGQVQLSDPKSLSLF